MIVGWFGNILTREKVGRFYQRYGRALNAGRENEDKKENEKI